MAYNKTTWQSGDVVTSAKLNNMESGIANAGTGFDCIIKSDMETFADATLTLIAGDFASAAAKLTADTPILSCVLITDGDGGCSAPKFLDAVKSVPDGVPTIRLWESDMGSAGAIYWTADGVEYIAN